MNILFLTTGRFGSIEDYAIYPDLLRQFRDAGHNIYTVSAYEKRSGNKTNLIEAQGTYSLHVKIGNLTNTNIIEKGITTLLIGFQYKRAVRKYFTGITFDLILYSTPPITLVGVVKSIKKRDSSFTYLLLKDIFPQNAVDIGLMDKNGLKGFLYVYFRRKEKQLYKISDCIGCMSKKNVDYVLTHNPEIAEKKVEVCPNCIDIRDVSISIEEKNALRFRYGIPINKRILVYGGNLGKPQGIPFVIECLRKEFDNQNVHFLIIGDGTEFKTLKEYIDQSGQKNVTLLGKIPKADYDRMLPACDIGLIFLDYRFTIPNYPSRLLPYMQAGLPIIACTDLNTDIGRDISEGRFGWWCESNDSEKFHKILQSIPLDTKPYMLNGYRYLRNHFSSEKAYAVIEKSYVEHRGEKHGE